MANDRGGLQYTIKVADEFSAATEKFRAEIAASKAAFAEFRGEVAKGKTAAGAIESLSKRSKQSTAEVTTELKKQTASTKDLAKALRKQKEEDNANARFQVINQRQVTRLRREAEAAERRASRDKETRLRSEERAAQRAQRAEIARLRALADAQRQRERQAQQINLSGRRDTEAAQRAQLEQIQRFADARAAQEKQVVALQKAAAKERSTRQASDPQFQAEQRVNALLERRKVAVAEINRLRALGREDLITKQLQRQAGDLKSAKDSANSLLFTFRRLVGVLAVFTLAREAVNAFKNLLVLGVQFNDQIARAEIGIAGLVTGLADVRNEQGQSLGLAQEFAAAQGEARRQVELLRQDALRTTATFDQLLDTFQVAIAPGFAAGFNLDEIRKLSVSISQAATAIGLPQNQLAEEIRSLLSGTIQARTTRIATALQITNSDIRRLRESGQLFEFLEERFKALGLAAEQAARRTLSGIGNLVQGAIGSILGKAAEPLFNELIDLGNELFDQALTVRDAAGNIKPNPAAVEAFKGLFDALARGVESARALGRELGFDGLQALLTTIGTGLSGALQFAIGFASTLGSTLSTVLSIVKGIASAIGLDVNGGLDETARTLGKILAAVVILKPALKAAGFSELLDPKSARAFGTEIAKIGTALKAFILTPLGQAGILLGGTGAIALGFQAIISDIFEVNLSLRETIALIGIGLASTIDSAVTKFDQFIVSTAGGIKKLFSGDEADAEIDARVKALNDALEEGGKKAQADLDRRISEIVNAARQAQGLLPKPADRPAVGGGEGGGDAAIISNVESVIAKASAAAGDLESELLKLRVGFQTAGQAAGLGGFGGEVAKAFSEQTIANATELREVNDALARNLRERDEAAKKAGISEQRLQAIRNANDKGPKGRDDALAALGLTKAEGQLVSLLRDEALLRETIAEFEALGLQNARLKVAIAAREALPDLLRQTAALRAQLEAEQAIARVETERLGARRLAVVQAQNELAIFRQQAAERIGQLRAELEAARQKAGPVTGLADPKDRALEKERSQAVLATITELERQLVLEESIAQAKEKQLLAAQRQAELAAEGTLTAGIRAGFEQLADDLPTIFEVGRQLVQSITNEFINTIASETVNAIAGLSDKNLRTILGELALSFGQQLLQQGLASLAQLALAKLLGQQTEQAVEVTAATTAAGIKTAAAATAASIEISAASTAAAIRAASGGGFAQGGLVPGFAAGGRVPALRGSPSAAHARAKGYARGGRPSGLDPRDTVPAWLQPGEFVIRKSVVDTMGAGFFRAVNSGQFSAPASGTPAGEGGALGMARGGRVPPQASARGSANDNAPIIVPAVVTNEREMDRLTNGSRASQLRFMRENASTIKGLLGI